MEHDKVNSNAAAIAETIKRNTKPEIKEAKKGSLDSAEFLIIPEGMKAESVQKYLEENRDKPKRRKGTIKTDRIKSFLDIVERFKSDQSVIFASAEVAARQISASVKAIFDYHPKGDKIEEADNCESAVLYKFPLSIEFQAWLEQNSSPMSQIDFAYFLEKRINDLSAPTEEDKKTIEGLKPKFADPIEILEMSRDLEIYSNETLVSKHKASSGEREIKFTSSHTDSSAKPLSIPDFMVLNIPVFQGGKRERILAHLRYRKQGEAIAWFYDLYNTSEMLLEAFEKACEEIQSEAGIPLYFGSAD